MKKYPFHKNPFLQLEVTTRCNARCVMCRHGEMGRKGRDMEPEEMVEIIDQAVATGVKEVYLHFMGELTLHPKMGQFLPMLRRRYPELTLSAYSSGAGIHLKRVRDVIIGNLDRLIFSVDGVSNKVMEKVRPGLKAERLKEGIIKFDKECGVKKPWIELRMTVMDGTEEEARDFSDYWKSHCDKTHTRPVGNYGTPGIRPYRPIRKAGKACSRIFRVMMVTVDWDLVLCCEDWNAECVIGNLKEDSLESLWHGDRFNEIRDKHLSGRAWQVPLCDACRCPDYVDGKDNTWQGKK